MTQLINPKFTDTVGPLRSPPPPFLQGFLVHTEPFIISAYEDLG